VKGRLPTTISFRPVKNGDRTSFATVKRDAFASGRDPNTLNPQNLAAANTPIRVGGRAKGRRAGRGR
jgi:hypothetical protein